MSIQLVGIGLVPNDNTGDPARTAFGKVNSNALELAHGMSGAVAEALAAIPANDPNTDAGPAIRAAIAASERVILDPAKTYYLNGADPLDGSGASCVFVQNRALVLDGRGAKIVTRSNRTSIQIVQVPTLDVTISAITTVNRVIETGGLVTPVSRLTVSATAGFVPGDVVKVASSDLIPGMATYQAGEFGVVGEVDGVNSHIYLCHVLGDTFVTTPRLAKARRNRIEIFNTRFNHDDAGLAGAWTATHLNLKGCVEPLLDAVTIERSFGHGIVDNSNWGLAARNLSIWDCSPSNGIGYGVFTQSSAHGRVSVTGGRCRHLFTTNPRNPASDDYFFRRGRTYDYVISGSAAGCRNAAFDFHGDAKSCRFVDCAVSESFSGPQSAGTGFQVAGDDCAMASCSTRGVLNGVQVLNRNTDSTPGVGIGLHVIDCDIEASDRALIAINSNTGDANNVRATISGGRLAGRCLVSNDMIQVTRADVVLQDVRLVPLGQSGGNMIRIPARGSVRSERCVEDFSQSAGSWQPVILTTPADSSAYLGNRRVDVSADRGDANVTLTMRDSPVQLFATPLTGNRTVTLPGTNIAGPPFRFVRTAAASGAFTLSIGGLGVLAASEWMEIGWNGTSWSAIGRGNI